jgi:hypothetical protein
MPGIDGMPPMGDVGGCSRRNFLKGAGFVGLSGFLAACQRQADKGSDGMPRSADYGRREPSPLSIELTDEERGEIDSLARMAAASIFERIKNKPNHLQVFSPEACVMLHVSDDRYEFKVDQNVTGCENDPDVGMRIWVTVKSGEYHNSNQPCSDDRIMLESPNRIDGDGTVSLEEIGLLLQDDKTRIARLLAPDRETIKLVFNKHTVSNYCPNKVTAQQITDYITKVYGV